MVKILSCYLYAKKSYGTLSKGAIFLAKSVYIYTYIDDGSPDSIDLENS